MSTMSNTRRMYFLKSVMYDAMDREVQIERLDEFLHERGPESGIARELNTQIRKIRFLQGLWNGTRKAEEITPIKAETWYYKEGKYRMGGTDRWLTRSEYMDMALPEGVLLVRMMIYLSECIFVEKPEYADLVKWLSPDKPLFIFDDKGVIRYVKVDRLDDAGLFHGKSGQAATFNSGVRRAERVAIANKEPFEVCYGTDFTFPNWQED